MSLAISMPRLADSTSEGAIAAWLLKDGDAVATGDELVEIETDKATVTFASPGTGILRILACVDAVLPVGAIIAYLD